MLNYKANKKLCNNLISNSQTKKHILSHIDFSILKKSVKNGRQKRNQFENKSILLSFIES